MLGKHLPQIGAHSVVYCMAGITLGSSANKTSANVLIMLQKVKL
jgi:hypothetical protein